ncbi:MULTISPECIES: hypothetical protein [unclassified Tolypothrix]|uniref:hypothetical protein n=1 Tax=unclassified Tolypothrix TaxID=2649714 RepID=UPI0005EAC2E6|nr:MULTISPECIES: hypothetical protein [unclassified Tolypothrix]BAY91419.1 hypothetical protein NIES3275_34420 [Microchaete diplosiphon NIES-3275]EKF04450.1 hypothetical protein FDUTEX481_01717 [Tolypothrix sp. PCC 7601]MBE9085780.1 hypothetical protein [Tolypothrix sp. LEGE 11397]UYD25462.1 hypothetical protein HGR01_29565 [Tolypothrix sp. PCC 7712]UYD32295.1 hypothetical protein HG267_24990 [Tolypothrix sp. PCC 7601]
MEPLPNNWAEIQADIVYQTTNGLLVSFASEQIKIGIKYDLNGKHLKAIEKGQVPARGNIGLVPSQEEGYDLKSKVLGKGGDRRFHGKYIDGVLHFPGLVTEH